MHILDVPRSPAIAGRLTIEPAALPANGKPIPAGWSAANKTPRCMAVGLNP
jgi:hypothetical protein